MDPWLIVFGFGVGILVGTTGMGGGSLMTPLLILLFGVKPVVAVGTDLAYAAITKTAGGFLHLRKGTVQTNLAWWLALGSCPGAILGVVLLERLGLERRPAAADRCRAAAHRRRWCSSRALISNGAGERETVPLDRRHKIAAVTLGAVGRLRARPHLRRLRHADRDRPDPRLSAHAAARRRHRRLPRRDPAVGRGARPPLLAATSTCC